MNADSIGNDIASIERKKGLYKTMKTGSDCGNNSKQGSIKSVKSSSRVANTKEILPKNSLINEYMQNPSKRAESRHDSVTRNVDSINKNLDKLKSILSQGGCKSTKNTAQISLVKPGELSLLQLY